MTTHRLSQPAALALAGLLALHAPGASAAGFAIIEQSVKGLGSAFAGGAASAEDGSTVFFNPAGMTRLRGTVIEGAGHIIVPQAEYTDGGSTLNAAVGGGAIPGSGSKDAGVAGAVPNLYYTRDLFEGVKFGLGINAPFGLKTDYSDGWVGRYHAISSALKTVNINPSIAHRYDNGLSIGVGVSAQYVQARLTNALDQSTICLARIGAAGCAGLGLTTPGSRATDGHIDLDADDWSFGYNIGLLYEFDENTRVGAHYRSKISHTLEGNADFSNTGALAGAFRRLCMRRGVAPARAARQ